MPDHPPPGRAAVFIFDLDGTVLSVNSFPLWATFMLRAPFGHLHLATRLSIRAGVALALASRKLCLSNHERLKWRLQLLWQCATRGDHGASEIALRRVLLRHVRPALQAPLSAVASASIDAVMATAAAADYAEGLAHALGFRHVISTPTRRAAPTSSIVGVHKRDAVMAFLADQGWQTRWRVLFTDHCDDLPLITMCDETRWYGTQQQLDQALSAAPNARITLPPHQWAPAPCEALGRTPA